MILRGQTDGMRLRRCGSRVGEFWILNFGFLIEEEMLRSRSPGTRSRGCGPDADRGRDADAPSTKSVEWSNRRIRDDAPYRWTSLNLQRPAWAGFEWLSEGRDVRG